MAQTRFKGGPVALNSGGAGPDDYLLKPIVGGRWTLVIFHWGRNWLGREIGKERANALAAADREAREKMAPLQHVCVPDNAQRWAKMQLSGNAPTMGAAEFWKKYG